MTEPPKVLRCWGCITADAKFDDGLCPACHLDRIQPDPPDPEMFDPLPESSMPLVSGFDIFPIAPDSLVMPLAPDPLVQEINAIRAQQAAFVLAVNKLIEVYRGFDKARRPAIKRGLKEFYEVLKQVGESLGVARLSLDNLWKG